jgi:hypothetical protein
MRNRPYSDALSDRSLHQDSVYPTLTCWLSVLYDPNSLVPPSTAWVYYERCEEKGPDREHQAGHRPAEQRDRARLRGGRDGR